MILVFKDVLLKKIELGDIEMVRNWRNDPKISERMFYKEHISKEMQLKWFNNLKETDYYFIIKYKGEAVGLINLNEELDYTAQVGLFIYNNNFLSGPIPIYASLALLSFAFEKRNLKKVFAKVQAENYKAQKYNELLGFTKESETYQSLSIENYQKKLFKLINKINS